MNGFAPIITTSSLKHESWLKSLGATHVIDRSLAPEAIHAAIANIIGDEPLLYACDAIGIPETQRLTYPARSTGGGLVTCPIRRVAPRRWAPIRTRR